MIENQEHVCLECGKQLIKHKYESRARFKNKKFCSAECSRKYLKKNNMGWWKHDNIPIKKENKEVYNMYYNENDYYN